MSIHDPCSECGRKLRLEFYKHENNGRLFSQSNFPENPPRNPNVTLPIERIKSYYRDYSVLAEFAAWVCGVESEKFCMSDIMKATGEWKRIGELIREANGVEE